MDDHGAADVEDLEDLDEDGLVDAVEEDLEGGHGPELEDTALAEDSSEGYQYCACAEVGQDQVLVVQGDALPRVFWLVVELHDLVPEAGEEDADLDGPAGDQVVEADGAPRVVLQKHHQEAEAHEDHHMHVLEARVPCPRDVQCVLLVVRGVYLGSGVFVELGEEPVEEDADGLADNEDDLCPGDTKVTLAHK